MEHREFHIGLEFYMGEVKWRCTDIGTRTICAIKLDKEDASWYNGPPYSVAEYCLDEYDIEGCSLTEEG